MATKDIELQLRSSPSLRSPTEIAVKTLSSKRSFNEDNEHQKFHNHIWRLEVLYTALFGSYVLTFFGLVIVSALQVLKQREQLHDNDVLNMTTPSSSLVVSIVDDTSYTLGINIMSITLSSCLLVVMSLRFSCFGEHKNIDTQISRRLFWDPMVWFIIVNGVGLSSVDFTDPTKTTSAPEATIILFQLVTVLFSDSIVHVSRWFDLTHMIALIFLFMLSVIETLLFNEDSLYFNFVGNEKMPVSRNSLRRFMFVNLFVSIGPMVMYLIKDKKRLHVRIVEKPIWRHEVVTNDAISDFRTTALDMQHLLEGLQKLETSVEKNWKEMQEFIHSRSGMNRTFTSSGLRQISLALNQQHSDKTVQTLGMEASEELCLTNKYNNKPTSIVEIEIEEEEEKHVHVSERKETQTKSSTRQQTFSHSHSHTSVHDFMIDHIRKLEKHREEHDRIIKESVKSFELMDEKSVQEAEEDAAAKKKKIAKYQQRTFRLEILYTIFMVIGMLLTIMLNLGLNRHPYEQTNNMTNITTTNDTKAAAAAAAATAALTAACDGAACTRGKPRAWFLPAAGLTLFGVIYFAIDRFAWCCHLTSNTDWSVAKKVATDPPVLWLFLCTFSTLVIDFASMGKTGNPVLIVASSLGFITAASTVLLADAIIHVHRWFDVTHVALLGALMIFLVIRNDIKGNDGIVSFELSGQPYMRTALKRIIWVQYITGLAPLMWRTLTDQHRLHCRLLCDVEWRHECMDILDLDLRSSQLAIDTMVESLIGIRNQISGKKKLIIGLRNRGGVEVKVET